MNRAEYGTITDDGRYVFVCENNRNGSSRIHSFTVSAKDGTLTKNNAVTMTQGRSLFCMVDPSGKYIVSTNFQTNTVTSTPFDEDGMLVDDTKTFNTCDAPHLIDFDSTGRYAYVPCRIQIASMSSASIPRREGLKGMGIGLMLNSRTPTRSHAISQLRQTTNTDICLPKTAALSFVTAFKRTGDSSPAITLPESLGGLRTSRSVLKAGFVRIDPERQPGRPQLGY